jgi:hypothetical protein
MPWLDRERRSIPEEDEYPDQLADQDEARTPEYLREVLTKLRAGSTPDKPDSPMNTERRSNSHEDKVQKILENKDGLAGGGRIPIIHSKSCRSGAFRKLTTV